MAHRVVEKPLCATLVELARNLPSKVPRKDVHGEVFH